MIGYPLALLLALLGKIDGYRWAMGLIGAGTAIALLGFRSMPRLPADGSLADYSDVVGWSGVVLAIYGLIVLQFSIWSTLERFLNRPRKDCH